MLSPVKSAENDRDSTLFSLPISITLSKIEEVVEQIQMPSTTEQSRWTKSLVGRSIFARRARRTDRKLRETIFGPIPRTLFSKASEIDGGHSSGIAPSSRSCSICSSEKPNSLITDSVSSPSNGGASSNPASALAKFSGCSMTGISPAAGWSVS